MLNYIPTFKIGQLCKVNIGDGIEVSGKIKSIYFSYSFTYKVQLLDTTLIVGYNAIRVEAANLLEEKQEYKAHNIGKAYYFKLINDFYPCTIIGVEFFKATFFERDIEREEIIHNYRIEVDGNILSSVGSEMILTKEEFLIKQRELKLKKI